MSQQPTIAYKVLTGEQFAELQEHAHFKGAPVDIGDGYIHMSTAEQLTETVDKHFAGQDGLHVAAIDVAGLGDMIKWEPSRGGALFPHLYGPLPLTAVLAHGPLEREDDGKVRLPG
ncbi:DUF952 domain-containing protein [Novosphingobium aquimarinum]|uniref:DUF952 domain-containing protein n=1 Tax=Novosphingobium aquimarinum TaxID=2682494 RepID=UPI0012EB70E9|nr:DUF952 domain-containing protein [Novosphingobium aquimarinum]